MSLTKIEKLFTYKLTELQHQGICKGNEKIITGMKVAGDGFGPRYLWKGRVINLSAHELKFLPGACGQAPSLLSANGRREKFGVGPGAVRFISGTYQPHIELGENKLAEFHGRESAMLFSSAYATMMGVLPQFVLRTL